MIHSMAWLGWLVAALVALSATRNPLHLTLILLCIAIVYVSVSSTEDAPLSPLSPLRFSLVVVPLSALFTALTAHFGDTVLFHLPQDLPVIGGAVTLEAFFFGLLNGLVLMGIFTALAALGQALPTRALIRLIPHAFFPVAVVVSISVTYVPVTMRQFQQIREAQAVRGHRVRGLRDWLPLLMPLLVGGLERALQLAEAMTARGFASAAPKQHDTATRFVLVAGLVGLLSGWLLRLVWGQEILGLALMLAGVALILSTLWIVGRQVPRTTYCPEPWTRTDTAVLLGAAVVVVGFALPALDRAALFYSPYPALNLPGFGPALGVTTLGLLVPALVWREA